MGDMFPGDGFKFTITRKHNVKCEDHDYFKCDPDIKYLKESNYSDTQIRNISLNMLLD